MTEEYTPPKVWKWEKDNGGTWGSLNRPIAGATHDKELPVGEHPFQLYSLATPNGQKVTILFEELLEPLDVSVGKAFNVRPIVRSTNGSAERQSNHIVQVMVGSAVRTRVCERNKVCKKFKITVRH